MSLYSLQLNSNNTQRQFESVTVSETDFFVFFNNSLNNTEQPHNLFPKLHPNHRFHLPTDMAEYPNEQHSTASCYQTTFRIHK